MAARRWTRTGLAALALAGGTAGLAACADYPPPPPPGPPPYAVHVQRCFARHPNYDPRTNTWWDGWGYPHPCRA